MQMKMEKYVQQRLAWRELKEAERAGGIMHKRRFNGLRVREVMDPVKLSQFLYSEGGASNLSNSNSMAVSTSSSSSSSPSRTASNTSSNANSECHPDFDRTANAIVMHPPTDEVTSRGKEPIFPPIDELYDANSEALTRFRRVEREVRFF